VTGAGAILAPMSSPKAENLTWHVGEVDEAERARMHGHRGVALWMTGLSGSGKSTVAHRVERRLVERGVFAYVLDGDNVRHGLNRDLGFSPDDRKENIRRIGEVARLFVDAGAVVLTAFVSPYREDRDGARGILPEGRFVEVFVDTPLEVCEARDPKGLYKKARAGEIENLTGLQAPYEPPLAPEIRVDTSEHDVDACAEHILGYLESRGVIAQRA
jgi:adenylylsulfate kinase